MTQQVMEISLALPSDAEEIAVMSKDLIEHGLSWRYTPPVITRRIRQQGSNVAVARRHGELLGFGIMRYGETQANLDLLAVKPEYWREGIGQSLVDWLELVAVTAGIQWVYVQSREDNQKALAFYRNLGYVRRDVRHGTYDGIANSVRLVKNLYRSHSV